MLTYQKNALLANCARFRMALYETNEGLGLKGNGSDIPTLYALKIIDRNLTSIEKQIKSL